MFFGTTNNSVDSKGRIVLPARFREELGSTFYFAKGFGKPCIQALSADEFNALNKRILELPADKAMALQYTFSATAVDVTPNAQGRVIIPQSLREFAQIEGEAVVVGMNTRVEIWNKSKYDELINSMQGNLLDEAIKELHLI